MIGDFLDNKQACDTIEHSPFALEENERKPQ